MSTARAATAGFATSCSTASCAPVWRRRESWCRPSAGSTLKSGRTAASRTGRRRSSQERGERRTTPIRQEATRREAPGSTISTWGASAVPPNSRASDSHENWYRKWGHVMTKDSDRIDLEKEHCGLRPDVLLSSRRHDNVLFVELRSRSVMASSLNAGRTKEKRTL